MNEFKRKHRREGMELQLTAMIDIFTMIVIFLVMGSVLGVAEVAVPPGMRLPKSFSVEGIDTAPQLVISKDLVVQLKFASNQFPASEPIPVAEFRNADSPALQKLKASLPKDSKQPLSVLADRSVAYRDVFDVIQFFRASGFESLLFMATGEKKGPAEGEGGS